MKKEEDILYTDFQGWPVYRKTLREILEELGAKDVNGIFGFPSSDTILDVYPRTLEDDGMGYGVNEEWFTEAGVVEDKEGNKIINIFRDKRIGE